MKFNFKFKWVGERPELEKLDTIKDIEFDLPSKDELWKKSLMSLVRSEICDLIKEQLDIITFGEEVVEQTRLAQFYHHHDDKFSEVLEKYPKAAHYQGYFHLPDVNRQLANALCKKHIDENYKECGT